MSRDLRVLELYCGLGGCAAALGTAAEIVAAVDISRPALSVYRYNFPHPVVASTLDSLPTARLSAWAADLWWLSPPCQPFTRRGKRRDIDDPRARSFLRLTEQLVEVRPRYLALENVPGFMGSRMHRLLRGALDRAGYGTVWEGLLCPSAFGLPNRRQRYYLVASRGALETIGRPSPRRTRLADLLEASPSPDLEVAPELMDRYAGALHVVRADDPEAVTACFTSAYGRSWVRSGSYLDTGAGLRRFSPREILRLLGFPQSYRLPPDTSLARGWRLVGNSLSLEPVRAVLVAVPELAALRSAEG